MFGLGALFRFLAGSPGDDSGSEYLGSDNDSDETIARLKKTSNFQHEIIVDFADKLHQHEIDRYYIVKKMRPDLADRYIPGTCDPFPEVDFNAEPESPDDEIENRWF